MEVVRSANGELSPQKLGLSPRLLAGLWLLGIVLGLIPYWIRHRYYLVDDMQNQFLPMFFHIGRLLREGQFPSLTLGAWWGGNILGEFQFAVFNPVSLALNALLPSFSNYERAAAFLACFYYGLLVPGTFVLARSFRISAPWALVAAVTFCCNGFLSYWAASNWFPVFSACTWLVWSWAFMRRALQTRRDFVLAVVFCTLTVTTGFPYAILLLAFLTAITALEACRVRRDLFGPILVMAPAGLAILFAAIPLLSMLAVGSLSTRSGSISYSGFLTPKPYDLLLVSQPLHFGWMKLWAGYRPHPTPIFFAGWYLAPLAFFLDWRQVNWRRPAITTLLVLTGLTWVAIQGPDQLGVLNYFIRYLPYYQLALILLFCLVASESGFKFTEKRAKLAFAVLGIGLLLSLVSTPGRWLTICAATLAAAAGVAAFTRWGQRARAPQVALTLGLTIAFFVATHLLVRSNISFDESNFPKRVTAEADASALGVPGGYTIYLGSDRDAYGANAKRAAEFRIGYQLESSVPMVNGYTGVGHKPLADLLCMRWNGTVCLDAVTRLFATEPETGARYLDLFRIDRIVVRTGDYLDALRPLLTDEWREEFAGQYVHRFVRKTPPLPSTLAWATDGIHADANGPASATREAVDILNERHEPGRLVFARLWWPGYRATLNDEAVPVRPVSGIFVGVDLPAGAQGRVLLSFQPPLLPLGVGVLIFGVVLLGVFLIFYPTVVQRTQTSIVED